MACLENPSALLPPCLFPRKKTLVPTSESGDDHEKLLPPDYQEILKRSGSQVNSMTKDKIYRELCAGILIDGGRKFFSLEESTGKKCYLLSARELEIIWENDNRYWDWIPSKESRFAEVAHLEEVWWMDISAAIPSRMLSPETNYVACLVVNFDRGAYGLDREPWEIKISYRGKILSQSRQNIACNVKEGVDPRVALQIKRLHFLHRIKMLPNPPSEPDIKYPCRRDGSQWLEIELGEFTTEGDDGEVVINVKETSNYNRKTGLTIEGVEFRPQHGHTH